MGKENMDSFLNKRALVFNVFSLLGFPESQITKSYIEFYIWD